jgi:hypothetical protein
MIDNLLILVAVSVVTLPLMAAALSGWWFSAGAAARTRFYAAVHCELDRPDLERAERDFLTSMLDDVVDDGLLWKAVWLVPAHALGASAVGQVPEGWRPDFWRSARFEALLLAHVQAVVRTSLFGALALLVAFFLAALIDLVRLRVERALRLIGHWGPVVGGEARRPGPGGYPA